MRSIGCTLKELEKAKNMQIDSEKEKRHLFLVFVGVYLVSIAFSYVRIYVYEDYPIYYSSEEIPDLSGQFSMILEKILP